MAITLKNLPTSYREAVGFINADGRTRMSRACGNNTYVTHANPVTAADGSGRIVPAVGIVLHRTQVVTFTADGRLILDSGGYETVTTKARINRVIRAHGYAIGAKQFEWYVQSWLIKAWEPVPFERGITLPASFGAQ